jgi:hypothetical protein
MQETCIFGHFDQKAWTIAHGFDGFWAIFTPFELFLVMQKTCIFGHFDQKARTI